MQCKQCREDKDPEEFYAKKRAKTGRESICKECKRDNVAENRSARQQHYADYDRERNKLPHRKMAKAFYNSTEDGKQSRRKAVEKWEDNNPQRAAAQRLCQEAIRQGRIKKPERCEGCTRKTKLLQAHHHDYSKPYSVTFLCSKCHRKADDERRAQESSSNEER